MRYVTGRGVRGTVSVAKFDSISFDFIRFRFLLIGAREQTGYTGHGRRGTGDAHPRAARLRISQPRVVSDRSFARASIAARSLARQVRSGLAPALIAAYARMDAVEGLDVDSDDFDKFHARRPCSNTE